MELYMLFLAQEVADYLIVAPDLASTEAGITLQQFYNGDLKDFGQFYIDDQEVVFQENAAYNLWPEDYVLLEYTRPIKRKEGESHSPLADKHVGTMSSFNAHYRSTSPGGNASPSWSGNQATGGVDIQQGLPGGDSEFTLPSTPHYGPPGPGGGSGGPGRGPPFPGQEPSLLPGGGPPHPNGPDNDLADEEDNENYRAGGRRTTVLPERQPWQFSMPPQHHG
ncbi:hypothetical protein E4T56_gene3721 [Termitomyces sp. T112]|nr:hypothetical protein E4T56_gene3721 [Termitomyces sp. T112]